MKCPTDNATLVMSERNGIEIDYCPDCRGVWLDRGELDKIIDRAATARSAPAAAMPQQAMPQQYPAGPQQHESRDFTQQGYAQRGYGDQHYGKKRKDNWLSELFD